MVEGRLTDARKTFRDVAATMSAAGDDAAYLASIEAAVALLLEAMATKRKLLVFGNGGSAADAEHIAAEFVGRFSYNRPPLAAQSLGSSGPLLTSLSNDVSFEDVFARQIEALGNAGDVAWGISTSGSSQNVIRALKRARDGGLRTIGLCGRARTEMGDYCDVLLAAPGDVTARIQEIHVVTYHVICAAVEQRSFPR